ncbi:IS110 family transposase [Mesorhizobium sp.]|uniref:IS110 family transposase n=1 Tax=Mesorhizobium sp. TaxID=1871066 RepID=UPI0012036FD0|nr:IS110 family transposase [Mesorhizobium sp.]TIP07463.1 MAG: IS110 family transposase [Mesorhizobium sp.]
MKDVSIIAVDLAKQAFQVHGAAAEGSVVFRKKLSRSQFLAFLSRQPACLVAMEACATSHYWGREIMKLGHTVRLIPPIYVKPFVKRHKNDAADAEAIAEAASRPTMRFVAVKSEEQQARAMIFRARDLLVRQRTQLINALRGHLAEFGIVVAKGPVHLEKLNDAIDELETGLPPMVREIGRTYLDQIAVYTEEIADLEKKLHAEAAGGEVTKRLQTMPGIGPVTALAIEAFAPPMESFRRGRDFSAWLGLVPLQKSTGGKQILGKTSKMGQRDIRRLLIIGAMAVVRWTARRGAPKGSWLAGMIGRKPRLVVAIALANKMARAVWAMLTKKENYWNPVAAA